MGSARKKIQFERILWPNKLGHTGVEYNKTRTGT